LTAKQTECSLDAWLIMMTFAFASRTVLKIALAVPCTPTMPIFAPRMHWSQCLGGCCMQISCKHACHA
jgi:hypothetical protein